MTQPLSPKQIEFVENSKAKWNLAHGAVSTGKTVGSMFAFLVNCELTDDGRIWMIGHTSSSIYDNCIRLIFETPELSIFRKMCTWVPSKYELRFRDKTIKTIGASNSGAIGAIQGKTMSLCYCDEMTLYPHNIIEMIDTRLRLPISKGFAAMNPANPSHPIKSWIDKAEAGDPQYYSLHFTLDDNPFLPPDYVQRMKDSKTGLFYKRYILGQWCLAEGAIFDFFDKKIHVVPRPPRSAQYWIAAIDYGTKNSFACVLVGCNDGSEDQSGPIRWVEKELVWNSKETERQKAPSEYVEDIKDFLQDYAIHAIYLDPSAAYFKQELARAGIHCVPTENDVLEGIMQVSNELKSGKLFICAECKTLIKEIEGYCWDEKKSERGEDAPIKVNDHAIDALRYALTHKIITNKPYQHNPQKYKQTRFGQRTSIFT
jgi:PBSX family phage terminase large subunit